MAATVAADQQQLANLKATAGAHPTSTQLASEAVIEGRIAAAQAALATLRSELVVIYSPIPLPPPLVTTPAPTPTPAPVIYSPIPIPAPLQPTPTAPVSTTAPVGPPPPAVPLLSPIPTPASLPDLSNLDLPIFLSAGVVGSPAAQAASEGWDYWRQIIGGDFTEAEYLFNDIAGSVIDTGTAVSFVEVGAGLTTDIAALEPVGFAAVILLSEYGFGWLLTKVSQYFPNPSIFGWHPLNFIVGGINNFGNQFKSSAAGLGGDLAAVFTQPIRQILGLFQRSGNATASAHNKVAHLHNSTIPQAQHDAVLQAATYTDQQIAQLTQSEAQAIVRLQRDVALQIADAKAALESASAAAVAKANADLVAMLQGDERLLASLALTVNTQIPLEIAAAVNDAAATENQRLTAASSAIENQIATLQGQITSLATVVTQGNATIAAAQATITQLESHANVDAAAIASEQATITQARLDVATATTAISDLNTQITGISDTLAPIRAAQQLNTNQLAPFEVAGALSLPVVITALATQLSKLQTKVDTCVVTTCDPTSPQNLKNQLMDLLGMLSAAGELAFIAEAIRNPEGTAADLAPSLDGIETGAFDALNALLSL